MDDSKIAVWWAKHEADVGLWLFAVFVVWQIWSLPARFEGWVDAALALTVSGLYLYGPDARHLDQDGRRKRR